MFSIVLITRNEAENIETCLKALRQVSDDIVVVDAFSEDGTPDLAAELDARVIQTRWMGYSQNKNFGNQHARYDWILSIDADEVLSEDLIRTLQQFTPEPQTVYELDRLTNFCGKWIYHSGWYPEWKPRLFDRREVSWQGDFVHETLAIPAGSRRVRLKGKLLHYSYKSDNDHRQRLERYAVLSAKDLYAQGKRSTLFKRWFSPVWRFLRTYIFQLGFLDGKEGWTIAVRGAWMVWRKYQLLKKGPL
ncbi:MAG: glycosyltransferase family 2 protein [Lewinellaceae bacterium]|nr:glycosyltransferase family 2 protein [Lewinellaceae bacterium]